VIASVPLAFLLACFNEEDHPMPSSQSLFLAFLLCRRILVLRPLLFLLAREGSFVPRFGLGSFWNFCQ